MSRFMQPPSRSPASPATVPESAPGRIFSAETDIQGQQEPQRRIFMLMARRPLGRALTSLAVLLAMWNLPAAAVEKARIRVDDYQIEAELQPKTHKLVAHARVTFTALEDINV